LKNSNLKIEYRPTGQLIPYVNNARKHSDKQISQIAASIKEFGFCNPILVDGENGVIAGHGRLAAAQKLGMDKVPCVELKDLTDTQRRAYILADNRLAETSEWDPELLKNELSDLKIEGVDFDSFGFSPEDIAGLVPQEVPGAGKTDEEDVPTEEKQTVSKSGDVWIMGDHRLICGDSAKADSYQGLLGDDKADMVFTDPPYGVAIGEKNKMLDKFSKGERITTNIQNDNISQDELYHMLVAAMTAAREHCAETASYYVTAPQRGGLGEMMMMMKDAGVQVRHNLVWVKNSPTFSMGRLDYDYRHEPIFYTWVKSHHFYGAGTFKNSVWEFDKPRKNDIHPTMKPVALVENAILNSTLPGDIVLDIFGGSGTTAIACEKTGRRARLIEISPHYCDVIVRRWQEFTGKKAKRENDGAAFGAD